jgi:hypothetical protein
MEIEAGENNKKFTFRHSFVGYNNVTNTSDYPLEPSFQKTYANHIVLITYLSHQVFASQNKPSGAVLLDHFIKKAG